RGKAEEVLEEFREGLGFLGRERERAPVGEDLVELVHRLLPLLLPPGEQNLLAINASVPRLVLLAEPRFFCTSHGEPSSRSRDRKVAFGPWSLARPGAFFRAPWRNRFAVSPVERRRFELPTSRVRF